MNSRRGKGPGPGRSSISYTVLSTIRLVQPSIFVLPARRKVAITRIIEHRGSDFDRGRHLRLRGPTLPHFVAPFSSWTTPENTTPRSRPDKYWRSNELYDLFLLLIVSVRFVYLSSNNVLFLYRYERVLLCLVLYETLIDERLNWILVNIIIYEIKFSTRGLIHSRDDFWKDRFWTDTRAYVRWIEASCIRYHRNQYGKKKKKTPSQYTKNCQSLLSLHGD